MNYQLTNGTLHVQIPVTDYTETTIVKALYWHTGIFSIDLTTKQEQYYITIKKNQSPIDSEDGETIINKLKRDLIDFKLRGIINEETKTVRELIIAKAFAPFDNESDPLTPIADEAGFDPTIEIPAIETPATPVSNNAL